MRIALVHPKYHSSGTKIAREACLQAVRALGGVHATVMNKQMPTGAGSSPCAIPTTPGE